MTASPRTIVVVEPEGEDSLRVKLDKAPVLFPDAKVGRRLDCDPDSMPPWTDPRAVEAHGLTLSSKLATAHPAIQQALDSLLRTPVHQRSPLYFYIQADEAERFWWEALCDPQKGFLALDARWPIARMADSGLDLRSPVHTFTPPLKVMALLSALSRDAEPEWRRLYEAVEGARAAGLPVEVMALVGKRELFQTLSAEVQAGQLQGVKVRPIPDRSADLATEMEGFAPRILHFFCHGMAGLGRSRLELAVFADWTRNDGRSTLVLDVEALMGFPGMQDVWLATLSCCEGGKAVERLHSMAYRLVANGLPTAVGMLEPIDAADAHEFCGFFYPAVFETLRKAIQTAGAAGNGETAEVQWTEALFPSRTALLEKHLQDPADNRRWVQPVLYVRPDPFQIRPLPAASPPPEELKSMKARAEMVAGMLRVLPPDTPLDTRQRFLDLLADLPPELRPDASGAFSAGG